jgi:hypothetical protein
MTDEFIEFREYFFRKSDIVYLRFEPRKFPTKDGVNNSLDERWPGKIEIVLKNNVTIIIEDNYINDIYRNLKNEILKTNNNIV